MGRNLNRFEKRNGIWRKRFYILNFEANADDLMWFWILPVCRLSVDEIVLLHNQGATEPSLYI